ncbi:MAG: hypothetical protein HN878_01645, partial [Candidatus Diapherotrites archaeon]|nr:hypothetical protein [Candidatus Diapherotrites archaeon]
MKVDENKLIWNQALFGLFLVVLFFALSVFAYALVNDLLGLAFGFLMVVSFGLIINCWAQL